MLPDSETCASIRQQIVNAVASAVDYVQSDEDGALFIVQDGYWFKMDFEPVDNGEDTDCGQCEGTGTTDAMGFEEECPVCDGTGQLKSAR